MTPWPLRHEYVQSGFLVRNLLQRFLDPPPGLLTRFARIFTQRKDSKLYVLVPPWHHCPVGYFMMVIGAAVQRQTSTEIHFLIDDIPYPAPNPTFDSELMAIEEMCDLLEGRFKVDRLSQLPVTRDPADQKKVAETAKRAIDFDITHRIGNRIIPYPAPEDFVRTAEETLLSKGMRLARLWQGKAGDAIFIPGGAVNGSWLFTDLAAHFGLRRASFDCGDGTLYLSVDGVAAHQPDNAKTYASLLSASQAEHDFAIAHARKARSRREFQGDELLQVKFDTSDVEPYDVVLCMSWEGDTAAIGLDYLFENARDWLETTIHELSKRRPGIRIAIRQHPAERALISQQGEEAVNRLRELQASGANIGIFDAFSDVSTYELSRRAKVVVVGATTFGIEAAMLGLPVVLFRRAYYAGTDFVLAPKDREDYFRLIVESVDGAHRLSAAQQDHAHLMYYIVELCNRDHTGFTPQPWDFLTWLENDPFAAMKSDNFQMIIRTVAGEAPYSLRKHQKLWAEHLETTSKAAETPQKIASQQSAATASPSLCLEAAQPRHQRNVRE